ncbi:MAG TPA: serine/threonine-protein kinase [Candidatus Polarisedimenticolia bacterium]|nr:serine/threonine-protein kinase [Candidatus Polarisedimenticolia bacterium]
MRPLDDRQVRHLQDVADLPDLTGTRYEMTGRLARGGMGTVYAVRDTVLGREVALKVLSAPDPEGALAARLAEEARHLARLQHPNIVPVHDAGRLPDGRAFYVMTLVRGERLDAWRAAGRSLSAMLRLFQRVCGAVAFAHARGVIHRDLKPENIMVGPFGEALVMDWGVAKRVQQSERDAEAATLDLSAGEPDGTLPGAIVGTPSYMAPEQARGDTASIGPRTDVYALGAILYFLICGRPPFDGPDPRAILRRVAEQTPPPPRPDGGGRGSRALTSIALKAMARDPAARYASAQEMSDDIERFLDGRPTEAHREGLAERTLRVLEKNRALVMLLAAYLLMRVMVLALAGF